MKHVFGPVASRRLKRSLGIDLIPYKTCSFDCIYCEVGKTTNLTVERAEYIPCDAILANVEQYLRELRVLPDYITLSGSGEPTLHSKIDTIITEIKHITSIPVAVLTNGSLLYDDNVKEALLKADVVLPSMDAASDTIFRYMCRPHPRVVINEIVDSLKDFREDFGGEVWLEILFCRGVNDSLEEIDRLRDIIAEIHPHKVQLNTVDRPPPEDAVLPLNKKELDYIKNILGEKAEIVAGSVGDDADSAIIDRRMRIVELLRRRPGTAEDIAKALRIQRSEVLKILDVLKNEGAVYDRVFDERRFYHLR